MRGEDTKVAFFVRLDGIVTLLKEEHENSMPRISCDGNCLATHFQRRRPKGSVCSR